MINEYKEFLEYTAPYKKTDDSQSVWGRMDSGVFKGIGFERYLTVIARGFLYHTFGENGDIEQTFSKCEAVGRKELAESCLKFWLSGDEKYIDGLKGFRPSSLKEYLTEVKKACVEEAEAYDDSKKNTSNCKSLKETPDKINDFISVENEISETHKANVLSVIGLWEKYGSNLKDEVEILKRLKTLLKNIPEKEAEDINKCKELKKYFSETGKKKSRRLCDRFYDYTQYKSIVTYNNNFNIKSVINSALNEGPLSVSAYIKINRKALGIIFEASKSNSDNGIPAKWVLYIFAVAYCAKKIREYGDSETDEIIYVPFNKSNFFSWTKPKKSLQDEFGKLFDAEFDLSCGKTVLLERVKYFKENDCIKIGIPKEIIDGITVSEKEETEKGFVIIEDTGITSRRKAKMKLELYLKEMSKEYEKGDK